MPDKPKWKLLGQQLTITLPITDPVSYHCYSVLVLFLYSNGFFPITYYKMDQYSSAVVVVRIQV